jgi:hypothetical protein
MGTACRCHYECASWRAPGDPGSADLLGRDAPRGLRLLPRRMTEANRPSASERRIVSEAILLRAYKLWGKGVLDLE